MSAMEVQKAAAEGQATVALYGSAPPPMEVMPGARGDMISQCCRNLSSFDPGVVAYALDEMVKCARLPVTRHDLSAHFEANAPQVCVCQSDWPFGAPRT
jgi:hypothetical protein